jgi:DNA-binding MarR family transcriptional regulator
LETSLSEEKTGLETSLSEEKTGLETSLSEEKTGLETSLKTSLKSGLEKKELYINLLTKNERIVLEAIYKQCCNVGRRDTGPFQVKQLADELLLSIDSVRTVLKKAKLNGWLERVSNRHGVGGYVHLRVPDVVFEKWSVHIPQTSLKTSLKTSSQSGLAASSSSETTFSENKKKQSSNTTTTEVEYDWVNQVDIPENLKSDIKTSHLRQLARFGFQNEDIRIVQESVDNLSFALTMGQTYRNTVAVFLSVMKREGYFSASDGGVFDRERAKLLLKKEQEAIEEKKNKIIEETIERKNEGSLDDVPF